MPDLKQPSFHYGTIELSQLGDDKTDRHLVTGSFFITGTFQDHAANDTGPIFEVRGNAGANATGTTFAPAPMFTITGSIDGEGDEVRTVLINNPVLASPDHSALKVRANYSNSACASFYAQDNVYLARIMADPDDDGKFLLYNTAGTAKTVMHSNGDSYFNGGSVGIGTTGPNCALHVAGAAAFSGPSETFVTMASGDTSPDISDGNIFKSHSDGVTIDQFDGGVCGQIITIISGGATVYDVTSSELKGGTTNITTAAGDVTMWVCESATVWHLLSWMDLSADLSSGGF